MLVACIFAISAANAMDAAAVCVPAATAPAAVAGEPRAPACQVAALEPSPAVTGAAEGPAVATAGSGSTEAVSAPAARTPGAPPAASIWGLQDLGSYLVVVDGVPWGGAFTPAVSRFNLADVERIDVQGGALPVLYGTAAFAGAVRVSRYAPKDTPGVLHASAGSYGSGSAGFTGALPSWTTLEQSLSVDVSRDRTRGPDQGVSEAHGLYRAAQALGGGELHLDLELETETRKPESPVARVGSALATTPLDANYQPPGARIGAHRTQANLGYAHDTPLGPLEVVASYAVARVADLRGFLDVPPSDVGFNGANAAGYDQDRAVRAVYADAHVRTTFTPRLALGWGADWQGGAAAQTSNDFYYYVSLDGARRKPPGEPGQTGFSDHRSLAGVYAELDWTATERLIATLTTRVSRNFERRTTVAGPGFTGPLPAMASESQSYVRGNAGASLAYHAGGDAAKGTGGVHTRLSYRNTSQPAAPDFGPDYRPGLLAPMNGRRVEAGARGGGDRFEWDLSASYTDVANLVVAQTDTHGNPVLANAGAAHVRALDATTRWQPLAARPLSLSAGAGWHAARFGTTHSIENGVPTDLVGREFALAPHAVASAGIAYESATGPYAAAGASYEGRRYLDRLNTAPVGGYTTVEARAGLRTARAGVVLRATNLTNRRDVVAESEFGDQAFYRNPARAVAVEFYVSWR